MKYKKQINKAKKINQKNSKGKQHTYAELSEAKRHTTEPAQTSLTERYNTLLKAGQKVTQKIKE